jgi:predicted hotdog family 3-hydroxylacyl-ACP dehydratase
VTGIVDRAGIARLIPHAGAMCLLDEVRDWSAARVLCAARSHLAQDNPLRRNDRLHIVCGCEYGVQAAAVHGALRNGVLPQPAGYMTGLRVTTIGRDRLDDPSIGVLLVEAVLELTDPAGFIYGFTLRAENGEKVLEGRGTISLPTRAEEMK